MSEKCAWRALNNKIPAVTAIQAVAAGIFAVSSVLAAYTEFLHVVCSSECYGSSINSKNFFAFSGCWQLAGIVNHAFARSVSRYLDLLTLMPMGISPSVLSSGRFLYIT